MTIYLLSLLYLCEFTTLKFNHAGFLEPVSGVQDQVWSCEAFKGRHWLCYTESDPLTLASLRPSFFSPLPETSHRFHSVVAECRLGC